MYVEYKTSWEKRALAVLLAVVFVFVGMPYVGVETSFEASAAEIHSTNSDKTSSYKTEIQMNANKSNGSDYTYSGKYTVNNKVSVFDYVSDYELQEGGSYNNCQQTESNYVDAYKTFNTAISNNSVSVSYTDKTSASADNVTIFLKSSAFPASGCANVHMWDDSGHGTVWPGPAMEYDNDLGGWIYTYSTTATDCDDYLSFTPKHLKFSQNEANGQTNIDLDNIIDLEPGYRYSFYSTGSSNEVGFSFKDVEGKIPNSATSYGLHLWIPNGSGTSWPGTTATKTTESGINYYTGYVNFFPTKVIATYNGGAKAYINDLSISNNGYSFKKGKTYTFTVSGTTASIISEQSNLPSAEAISYRVASTSTIYETPLYFGCFYNGNNASDYINPSLGNPKNDYYNFYWQANMGLKAANSETMAYRGSTVVQGLVDDNLYGGVRGNLLQNGSSTLQLPYFDTEWADNHSNIMKYYNKDGENDITFPFYEVTATSGSSTIVKNGDSLIGGSLQDGEKSRFYQFRSTDANLKFNYNVNVSEHSGYFEETNIDILKGYWGGGTFKSEANDVRSNVGFYPFNTTNVESGSTNNHNLGFGTKYEMDFELEPDGCVKPVTCDADGTNVKTADSETRIHTIFEFEGDDDLWVFIDGKLVLDMGGDHNKSHGVIDFAARTVTIDKAITLGDGDNSDDLGATIRTPTTTPSSVEDLTSLLPSDSFNGSNYTSKTHTMTIFYMERGMLDSNLLIRFNYTPISNASKMKVAEVTKFDNVNDGLLALTKRIAEDDIFEYTVSNKGTLKADVNDNEAKFPITTESVRTSEDTTKTTTLTPNGTLAEGAEAATIKYLPPGGDNNGTWVDDINTESRVSGTSYLWVDEFASNSKLVGKTTGTAGTIDSGGELYLMYGTSDQLYGDNKTGKESSAEFQNQFSKNSIMKILQGDNVFKLDRDVENSAVLFDSSTQLTNAQKNTSRAVKDYYETNYRIVDRVGNIVARNSDSTSADYGTFVFNNRTAEGDGVTTPVNEYLAVQLTEYVENTVKTSSLQITKNVTGLTTNPKDTEYKFKLGLTSVFGDSSVPVTDYTGIVVTKTGEVGTSTPITNATNSSNTGIFTLQKGQTMTISGIPNGTKYTITEITDDLHQKPNAESTVEASISGEVSTPKTVNQNGLTVSTEAVTNAYKDYVDVTVNKTAQGNSSANDLNDAELELWYKETTTTKTYSTNEPEIVPSKKTGVTVAKTSGEVGIPGLQESSSSYTYYTNTPTYSNPTVPSAEDYDWILPRSDADYIYFRDYNVGQYAADKDKQSFSNTTGKRSWIQTTFAAKSNDTHQQDQELEFTDQSLWVAAQFTGNNKQMVQYAVWERFVDKFTYNDTNSASQTVDTVVWKIQPPDGYTQVRFLVYSGNNCIRTTEKFTYKLGEIYHKTNWGGSYSDANGGSYYNVPVSDEDHNLWAPNAGSTADNRNTSMDQPRKYTPTNNKIIFHCNSLQVWHNIHIEFFTDDNENTQIGGQAFPGYMMEPYAYAQSDYRLSDGYLTYELTIPEGANYFRINNGVSSGSYSYMTAITEIQTNSSKKNGGNYFILGDSSNYSTSTKTISLYDCTSSGSAKHDVQLYQCEQLYIDKTSDNTSKTYSDTSITSDGDYVYFMADSSWGSKVYAYFYGGGNLRDDNWQRACYSAWPGAAPVGTDYQITDGDTATVHSNTYSINTIGDTYNGSNANGTLSPEAIFTFNKNSTDYTVYKFRLPKGDRKNYSKVIFNNGLNGGKETDVIEYHAGYMYTKSGAATKHYDSKPTVTYTARTNNNYSGSDKTEYIYIKNTDGFDDPHIIFYDNSGNQILQSGCGYVMDYAGNQTESSTSYEYYHMPIPNNAAKFSVNNGIDVNGNIITSTEKYDIIRYDTGTGLPTDTQSSGDKFVYDLSGTALSRLDYSAGTPTPNTVKTNTAQTESVSNYNPNTLNSGVRQTGGTDDTLNIRDDSPWNVPIGGVSVMFYNETGTVVGSDIMMKTNVDSDDKVWFTKKIPIDAKSFSVSYTKGSTPVTTTTSKYPIYSGTEDQNGNISTSGNMYYKTVGTNSLSIINAEANNVCANDETYEQRGDYLYLKCLMSEKDSYWKNMKVTFYANGDTVIRSGVTAKFVNDDGTDSWYRVSIPTGAQSFTVTGGETPHTTVRADIYELKTKLSRYQKDYTLGDMQYELPSSSGGGTAAKLLYPIFTEDDEYTLTVGGNTISTTRSLTPIDASQISGFANASTEPRPATDTSHSTDSPVLYSTENTNVTYEWTDGAGGSDYPFVRFQKPAAWTGVEACYYNSSNVVVPVSVDSYSGDIYKFKNDNNYTKVFFRNTADNNQRTIDIDLIGDSTHTYGYGYLYETSALSGGGETFTTYEDNLLVQVVEPSSAEISITTEDRYGMISELNSNYDSVLGFNDVNNFIYVTIPNSITKQYIKFYDSSDALISSSASNGLLLSADDLTLNGESYSIVQSTDNVNNTKTYRVRLPKNAKKFAICDGTNTGEQFDLYPNSITVNASDGQLTNSGEQTEITDFHHAGSSFTVDGTEGTDYLKITLTNVRDGYTAVKNDMEDPLIPKTDADFVFLTLPSGLSGWTTPYAYYYGAQDGEYSFAQGNDTVAWPGVRATGTYTDKSGRTVYRFPIPKTSDGKYSYVMFNSGSYANGTITEGKVLTPGTNYVLDSTPANQLDYGTSVKAYALTMTDKAPNTTTVDYSSGSYIYIINNGTQNLTNNTVETNQRTTLDEMHVVFYSDPDGANVIGSGSINGYNDAGYVADKIGVLDNETWTALKYTDTGSTQYDVYRIQVPSNAKYFQINNGFGKGEGSSNYSLRKSEIKSVTPNGLYKFVEGESDASKYIEGSTLPADAAARQNPRYLLTLVQTVEESDEELPTSGTVDVHLATIVTDNDGTQKYIKWLKTVMEDQNGAMVEVVDTNYLNHIMTDIGETAPNNAGSGVKTVKVKKDGSYYWKEVIPPSGYKINPTVTNFTISGYDHTNNTDVPEIEDTQNPTGSLSISKSLYAVGNRTNSSENQNFTFTVTLTAPIGTDWNNYTLTYTSGYTPANVTTNGLTRSFDLSIPATGTAVEIGNIPSGTAYFAMETAPNTNYTSSPYSISKTTKNGEGTATTNSADDISGTIPSYSTTDNNDVAYAVTNKREVGSLTLAKTVTGTTEALSAANVTKGTTSYTYTVTLTAPDNVDLHDYLAWSSFNGISATITKINDSTVSNYTESNYNDLTERLSSIEFKTAVKCDNGSKTISNLPMGTGYSVIENNHNASDTNDGTNWNCTTTGEVESSANKSLTNTGASPEPNPVVTINNAYTASTTPPDPSHNNNEVTLTKRAKDRVGDKKIGEPLENAVFKLCYKSDDSDVNYHFDLTTSASTDVSGKNTNVYTYTTGAGNATSASLTTGEDGRLHIKNLPNGTGTYYLVEQTAPAGYAVNDQHFEFTVTGNTVSQSTFTCYDEMAPAYIKLYEHINEKKHDNWGDPTFIFKITQTKDASNNTPGDPKEYTVALTVDDDGKSTVGLTSKTVGSETTYTYINSDTSKSWLEPESAKLKINNKKIIR